VHEFLQKPGAKINDYVIPTPDETAVRPVVNVVEPLFLIDCMLQTKKLTSSSADQRRLDHDLLLLESGGELLM